MRFVVKKEIFEELLPYREAFRALNILSNIVLNELDWWVASQWENMPIHYEYKTRQNFSCAIKQHKKQQTAATIP